MDWDAWARRTEEALDFTTAGRWRDLFAPDAVFGDPNTPSTTDLRSVQRGTAEVFPDWRQEITTIRGGDDWAVFEWIGRATYAGRGETTRWPAPRSRCTARRSSRSTPTGS